jgi:flagellar motor switch protein FliG
MFMKALKGASREMREKFFRYSYLVNPIDYPNDDYGNRMYKTFEEFQSALESMKETSENVREAQEDILEIIIDLSTDGELLFPLVTHVTQA